jgi:serine phosphatase RsbU (regulator of sigma subunit)
LRVSTALVDIAASGQTATFSEADRAQPMGLHSIAELQIHSAVCVPVRIDRRIVALLYVDARGRESKVDDAASFCEDVAQLLGLALAYAARTEQSKRQAALQAELERARSLRDLLTPPEVVEANGWRIAHRTLAGLFVSGDLFDVAAGPKDAAPVLLFGDATGHGVGAAMLTSLVHAHLHATVTQGGPLDAAVERTNGFVTSRPTGGSFVSLFAAALGAGGELSCLDAGHGYWRLVRAAGEIEPASRATGPPLGVDAEARYPTTTRTLGTRDRLVLFTDGVVEQRDASGRELGLAAVDAALRGSASAEDDVTRLLSMLEVAAGQRGVDDDATVASIERLD